MRHHKHPGLAGRLAGDGTTLEPHPDAGAASAQLVWFPLPDTTGREVDALEGLMCVPTRSGAMRVVSVPHVASHLALGDEVAVADWEGEPIARGELASSLAGTVRVVLAEGGAWHDAARGIVDVVAGAGRGDELWFDVIGDAALAASVPRTQLTAVFAHLGERERAGELRWEYATPQRHT